MITVDIDVTGLKEAFIKMQTLPEKVNKIMFRTSYRVAALIKDTASWYAPISPTQSMLNQMRMIRLVNAGYSNKQIRKFARAGKKRRKPNASSRPMPGALQNSITFRYAPDFAEVYVPSNSPAGSYAVKIHDEKGKTWRNRGFGTQAKGAQADEKFIERAMNDNILNINRIIDDQMLKLLKG